MADTVEDDRLGLRPLIIKAHTRPITEVLYNRDGDLILSSSKDHYCSLWLASTGEQLGTYHHPGNAVYDVSIDRDSRRIITCGADYFVRMWEVETGAELCSFEHTGLVRSCNWSMTEKHFLSVLDAKMGAKSTVFVYRVADDPAEQSSSPTLTIDGFDDDVLSAVWADMDRAILTFDKAGVLRKHDSETGKVVETVQVAQGPINASRYSKDGTMLLLGCSDNCARLLDAKSLQTMCTYKSDRPIRAVDFSPVHNVVVIGGGQEAREVTTTSHKQGKFETFIYDIALEDMIGSYRGHFGPVNALSFSPDGQNYVSAGEDGYLRVHYLNDALVDRLSGIEY